jgi:hypothetical protein
MGPKFGLGANEKNALTPIDAPNPMGTFWGTFILHHDGTKNDL